MSSTDDIRSVIDTATTPDAADLDRARMIIVDKLGERGELDLDELVESVCEAYESPAGEPLRVADVDPTAPDTETPALRNLRYARAAREAVIALEDAGRIRPLPGGTGASGPDTDVVVADDRDESAVAAKETTAAAAEHAGADEVILSTGPVPRARRYALDAGRVRARAHARTRPASSQSEMDASG